MKSVSGKVVGHSLAYRPITIHAKIIVGGRPLLPEILGQTDRIAAESPIFDLFSLLAKKVN